MVMFDTSKQRSFVIQFVDTFKSVLILESDNVVAKHVQTKLNGYEMVEFIFFKECVQFIFE